jgi:hypothetical protein
MMLKKFTLLFFIITNSTFCLSQEVLDGTLLKADKLFINRNYEGAVEVYLKYLEKYPREYYAERQTALCYNKLNKPYDAIDHWPIVVESSDATEYDYLEYGKSLLANDRLPQAKKIFMVLSRSENKSLAAWGKLYLNPAALYIDSAATKVMEVKGLNSEQPESCPVIFKDKMYYLSNTERTPRMFYTLSDYESERIAGALKKDSLNLFPSILNEKLHLLPINGSFCFSPDGATLYFTRAVSNKEMKIKSSPSFYRYQIYMLTMSTIGNLEPVIKKFNYNSPEYDFMHPCLSKDGLRLYFVSNMKGSLGGKDVFVCEWTSNGWGAPKNLGSEVNSQGNEVFPYVSEDNTLYFSSDHLPGLGGLDIFSAAPSKSKDKIFEQAENLGAPMNSRFDDFGVFIYKGNTKGYLSSNRKNNTDDDLYYFYKTK